MLLQRMVLWGVAVQFLSVSGAFAQIPPPVVPPTPHFNSIDPHPPTGVPLVPEVPVSPGLLSGSGSIATEPLSSAPIYTVPSRSEHKKSKVAQKTKSSHRYRHSPVSDGEVPKIMQ